MNMTDDSAAATLRVAPLSIVKTDDGIHCALPKVTLMPTLNVVRCYGYASEDAWWTFLLSDFDVHWHDSPDFSLVLPDALYAIQGVHGLGHVPEPFLARVRQAGNAGLLHIGDEFLRGPYPVYASFSYVLRNLHASFLEHPGVLVAAMGYSNNCIPPSFPAASARPFAWSFSGADGASRRKMVETWRGFTPSHINLVDLRGGGVHESRERFLELLRESAFVPCPQGNVYLELMRMYEALENGAIPIVSKRRNFAYWETLFGPQHPLPAFYDWRAARAFAEGVFADKPALDALQTKILQWWAAEKLAIRARVRAHVEAGRRGDFREALQRDFAGKTGLPLQAARLIEVLRHHDATALRGRAQIVLRRLQARLAG
jgi:hypothetical protein